MAVHRIELPQRRLRAGGLQLAVQLDLQRPREQHVAGHADDDRLGGDALERVAHRLRIAPIDPRSIASLSSRNVLTGKRSAKRRP